MPDAITRDLPSGGPIICAAGIHHRVSMETYLACEAVAAHDLWNLHNRCPAYAIARHPSHPNPEPDRESAALALGELAHTLVLEGDAAVKARYVVKPEGMKFSTTGGKAWRAGNCDREIVEAEDMAAAIAIRDVIMNNSRARMALEGCDSEVTLLATDPETGLAIKNRPDAMRSNLVVNIKTAANAHPRKWADDALKYGYHVSEAMTAHILKIIGAPPRSYTYVVVEKAANNPIVQVRTLPHQMVEELGALILRRSLRRWATCAETGNWPPYHDDVQEMAMPSRALTELEFLQREEL